MRNASRIACFGILFVMVSPIIAMPANADGGSWGWYDSNPDPELLLEQSQYALINYDDDYEKMIIQISIEKSTLLSGKNAIWIFPVPASPENVSIDVFSGMYMPVLYGTSYKDLAKTSIDKSFYYVYSSQIYAFPIALLTVASGDGFYRLMIPRSGSWYSDGEKVIVHDHLERFGLSTELISATNSSLIDAYLIDKGLNLPENAKAILREYTSEDYSFSVSWISNTTQFIEQADPDYGIFDLGISIGFPTEKIFFPLKLTSVYGKLSIPITLKIIDPVIIAPDQDFINDLDISIDYAFSDSILVRENMSYFFDEQSDQFDFRESYYSNEGRYTYIALEYTEVTINAESQEFTDDLWLVNEIPIGVQFDKAVISNWPAMTFLMIIFMSIFSSFVSGMILFNRFRPSKWKFALLGLSNLLTIIGVALISYKLQINREFIDKSSIEENMMTKKGPGTAPICYFVLLFTGIFVSSLIAMQVLFLQLI